MVSKNLVRFVVLLKTENGGRLAMNILLWYPDNLCRWCYGAKHKADKINDK